MGTDVGLDAVEYLFKALQVDEEWSIRRPRGFTWWSYRLAQHIDATEPWQDDEFQLSRIPHSDGGRQFGRPLETAEEFSPQPMPRV